MTKKSLAGGLRRSALAMFILVLLMAGCASTPEPNVSVTSMPEPPPAEKPEPSPSETANVAEQKAVAEVDENNSIFFSLGSSTINRRESVKLRPVATALKSNKAMFVTLIGHANENGSRSFNLAVADARVESVSKVLKQSGVRPLQIKKKVIGSEKISSACRSSECRRKMRRVELVMSTQE